MATLLEKNRNELHICGLYPNNPDCFEQTKSVSSPHYPNYWTVLKSWRMLLEHRLKRGKRLNRKRAAAAAAAVSALTAAALESSTEESRPLGKTRDRHIFRPTVAGKSSNATSHLLSSLGNCDLLCDAGEEVQCISAYMGGRRGAGGR